MKRRKKTRAKYSIVVTSEAYQRFRRRADAMGITMTTLVERAVADVTGGPHNAGVEPDRRARERARG